MNQAASDFGKQLESLRPKLMRQALNLTRDQDRAADLVQSTMLKAWGAISTFDGSNLGAWTATILRNAFLTEARKGKRDVEWDEEKAANIADEGTASGEQKVEFSEALAMLGELNDESRRAIELMVEGKSYREAAAEMGVAEGTVKSRVFRAREKLEAMRGEEAVTTSQRRFEELPKPSPPSVVDLPPDHPAILQKLPLFESTIVRAKDSPRVLISGHNSRKIGKVVTKGAWKGFPIFTLTLAERMTCPSSCHMWNSCYGNAMPFARRHRPGEDLEIKIACEVKELAEHHPSGFVVRLHVLGDFYSEEYVRLWERLLDKFKALHIFGYTARMRDTALPAIGNALFQVRSKHPDRFCIRPSEPKPLPGAAVVISRLPEGPTVAEGIVCPAEREATACCATCGLCWEAGARDKTIVFLKHGMGSQKNIRIAGDASKVDARNLRPIAPLSNLAKLATQVQNDPPTLLWVKPEELRVDETYQRNLSSRSIRLIAKIVANFNWSHFKTPIAVKDEDANIFFIIDGQHTAIAAATHPKIDKIPIMVVDADSIAARASGFISHNRDRITVTPTQLHHSSVVAGDASAIEIDAVCESAGVRILKNPPPHAKFAEGETMALSSIRTIIRKFGAEKARMVLACLVEADRAPVRSDEIKALALLLFENGAQVPQSKLAEMLRALPYDDAIHAARDLAASSGVGKTEALAAIYAQRMTGVADEALEAAE